MSVHYYRTFPEVPSYAKSLNCLLNEFDFKSAEHCIEESARSISSKIQVIVSVLQVKTFR